MTDEELLELAAKVGGIWVDHSQNKNGWEWNWPIGWDSLEINGDAFLLMTKLQMRFESTDDYMVCYAGTVMTAQFTERVINGDRDVAARRAITSAAAHIGSKLK